MATISDPIIASVRRFLMAVQRRQRLDAAYLYGSQATGTATAWSDIDLALVSPDFSADLFVERVALMRLAAQVDDRIEPHPFTPQDFNPTNPVVSEIQRTGIRVL